jgi:hypothetical protein
MRFLVRTIIAILLSSFPFSLPIQAFDLGDGKTTFEKSPRLIQSGTTFRSPFVVSDYYFTIYLPEDAGEPLETVTIIQQTNLEQIVLYPEQTRAFLGENLGEGESIPIASVRPISEENGVKITLAQPVQPGKSVTIVLRGINPLYGGIYQFGVTAFPVGKDSLGLYLGIARFHFNSPGGHF